MPDHGKAEATSKRMLLIVNPQSRRGRDLVQPIATSLRERGLMTMMAVPDDRKAVSDLIIAHAHEVDGVVVAGGDGTLNAAARGLRATGLPLGIIPAGTANDLARTLGLPEDSEACVDIIARGQSRRIDLGLVNDCPFFNVASIGLSAQLAKELTYEAKQKLGRLGYAVAALKVLMRARPFRAILGIDGTATRVSTLQIAVGNGRFYGGGLAVEETADIDDGQLDLYSLELAAAWKLALMLRSFRHGKHGAWDEVRAVRGTNFEVRTRRPMPINADGEIVSSTPARFAQCASCIEVFTA